MTAFNAASFSAKLLLGLIALFSAAPSVLASTEGWNPTETEATWVNYPSDLDPLIEAEKRAYVDNGDNNNQHVDMTVFQYYPEFKSEQRIWPLLTGMIRRMDGVLTPQVAYYLLSGTDFGCRELAPNGTETPVESTHCHRHCTHEGRYCANHTDFYHGRHVVQEIARRICLADNLSNKLNSSWYASTPLYAFPLYLQEFEHQSCVTKDHLEVHDCSLQAMATVGIPTNDPDLLGCLEPDWHSDEYHPLLERNLEQLQQVSWNMEAGAHMPQIELNGEPILTYPDDDGDWTTGDILDKYCNAFPSCTDSPQPTFQKPLACHVCAGCSDMQTCLWTLTCDGKPAAVDTREIEKEAKCSSNNDAPPGVTNLPNIPTNSGKDKENNQSATNEQASSGGLLFVIIMVVTLVAAATAAFCYRRRDSLRFKDSIIEKSIDTEKVYSDHTDSSSSDSSPGGFQWGMSVRNRDSFRSKNIAPRPSEDNMQDELDAISFDEFMITNASERITTSSKSSPPQELFHTISMEENDEHWV